jgi:hypothetical protein
VDCGFVLLDELDGYWLPLEDCEGDDDDVLELVVCAEHVSASNTVIARIVLFIASSPCPTPWLGKL